MRITGTIACVGICLCAWVEFDVANGRHHKDIAKIRVSCATEMSVTKTHDSAVLMLITSTVFIYPGLILTIDVMGHRIGIGTQLHDAEWSAGSGKSMAHAVSPYDRVYIMCVIGSVFIHSWFFSTSEKKQTESNGWNYFLHSIDICHENTKKIYLC